MILTPTLPTTIATTVTPKDIKGTYFLKYVHITLTDKDKFLNFYNNLVTQATRYNIFLRPSFDITQIYSAISDDISSNCIAITATTLHFKFCQRGTIVSCYKDVHNLFATTTDGFVFQ